MANQRFSHFQKKLRPLAGLWPFVKPYMSSLWGALIALTFAALSVLAMGVAIRYFIDVTLQNQSSFYFLGSIFVWFAIIIILAFASFARLSFISHLSENLLADIRREALRKLVNMKPAFYETTPISDILSRLTTDATILQTIIGSTGTMALRNILLLVGGTIMLLVSNPKMTLYVFLLTPIIVIPLIYMAKKVKSFSNIEQDALSSATQYVEEALSALPVVQAYNQEQQITKDFEQRYLQDTKKFALARVMIRARFTFLIIILVFGAVGALFFLGGHDVLSGNLTGGELSSFTFYSVIVASSIAGISDVIGNLQRAAASADRLLQLVNIDVPTAAAMEETDLEDVKGHIAFENVSFAYPSRSEQLSIRQVSFAIEPGQTVAFIGASGSGKSTLLKLLLKYYEGYEGKITLDQVDIQKVTDESLRRPMAYVSQNPVMFSTGLWQNICFGVHNASEKEIENAIEMASLSDFIDMLPNGYHTDLGQKALRISDGQKQRIGLARAFLTRPKLLLLDEAMNALDADNEARILENLSRSKDMTIIMVTHRVHTIENADQIFVMDAGSIVNHGSHEYLFKNCSLYRSLLKSSNSKAS